MRIFKKKYSAANANLSFRKQQSRSNVSLTPSETRRKGNYVDPLIKKKRFNYYQIKDRYAVCRLDSIAKKLTYAWAQVATAKTFKFYSSHEIDGAEVMQDIRSKWIELNCDAIFRKALIGFERDGFTLLHLRATKDDEELVGVEYDVYSEFEAPPALWLRDEDNKILGYRIQYTPQPRAFETLSSNFAFEGGIATANVGSVKMVNKFLSSDEVIHVERNEDNLGFGDALIEGAWDSITKLREESHMEMIDRRLVPQLILSEDDYDPDHTKANQLLKMLADSDVDTARIW